MHWTVPVVVLLSIMFGQAVESSKVTYQEAATRLREEILKLRDEELRFTDMQQTIDQQSFKRIELNASAEIEKLTENMGEFFKEVFGAVRNIQRKLETLYASSASFTVEGFDECCKIEENLEYSADFKTEVKFNMCYRRADTSKTEYVPTSEELQDLMKENRNIPSVKWQYYGTEVGTIAIYPGHKAQDCDEYDPRFRPWYVEVATPTPKDVVIVMDRSSSMDDNDKLTLSKAAAKTVIDTLNPNDRVSLVQFSTEAYTPLIIRGESCYRDQMAFATPEVKTDLEDYVEKITADGVTRYTNALTKAFGILKTAGDVPNTLNRRKVILFLTDGGSQGVPDEGVKNLLSELNADQHNRVLILTYGIGNDIMDGLQLLKDMANMTVYNASAGDRQVGHFEHIPDTSQLRTKFGSYYNHFKGVLTPYKPIVTVPYVDFFKLGHIFSVCLSVRHSNALQGVTCIDVLLNDIRQKFAFLEDETIYAFIIDQTGRTLLHPLLPSPGEDIESDPLFVNISVLEPEAQSLGIIDRMRQLSEGQQEISKTMAISRGNARYDGTDEVLTQALYSWRKIPETNFSVCLVVVPGHVNIELESRDLVSTFHYHLYFNAPMCAHGDQSVTTDFPTYYFSDKAYDEAPLDKDENYVAHITAYLEDEDIKIDFNLKTDIRGSVAAMDGVASQWRDSFKPYILKKYMGTFQGIYVTFPGRQLSEEFDHTVSSWYRRAKKNVKSTVLYRQPKGIRLTQAITQGSQSFGDEGSVWGVMGMDLKTSFFQNLLTTQIEKCDSSDEFSCFLMDNNGYLLFHPDIAENSSLEHLPIFQYEPDIATSLIGLEVLLPKVCTDYAWKEKYHTWKVTEHANPISSLEGYPYYFFTPVGDTNLYFIMKDESKSSAFTKCASCSSDSDAFTTPIKCRSRECYCPCYEDPIYQYCTNSFTEPEGSQPDPPCLKTEDTKEDEIAEESSKSSSQLAQCYPHTCDSLDSDHCGIYPDCDWCYKDHSTQSRSCLQRKHCIYEQSPSVTEQATVDTVSSGGGDKNLVSIIVPIVVVILLIVTAVIILYMHKRGLTPCNVCTKPKVQADGLYSDIPSDGETLNSRAEMIRQEPVEPYGISPVGFMNHSYGSSGRISVIGPTTNSDEAPQYFTTNSAQPMVFMPVQINPASGTTSSPDVSYLAVGSDLVQPAQQSLSSSGYASPVSSSTSSQQGTGTGNAIPLNNASRALPDVTTSGPDNHSPPPHSPPDNPRVAGGIVYINNPQTTGTGYPLTLEGGPSSQQAFILTPVPASQLALSRSSANHNTAQENSDCNAADITQHSLHSNSDQASNQNEAHNEDRPQVSSHGYLTTGFFL